MHPRGVQPATSEITVESYGISIHAPTRGATVGGKGGANIDKDFNPCTHAGCNGRPRPHKSVSIYFNPCTHAGCNLTGQDSANANKISIHAPTRGATEPVKPGDILKYISIHAPTRGATLLSTFILYFFNFNPCTHAGCNK